MPRKIETLCIQVPFDTDIKIFIKNARKAHRQFFPDGARLPGRHSEEKEVLEAMKSIFMDAMETSVKGWTQGRWTKKINQLTNISPRTIQKHFKEIVRRNIIPLHMIPASFVKLFSPEQQRSHWLAVAWGESILDAVRANPSKTTTTVLYQGVADRHRQLLEKHKVSHPA